MAGAHKEEMKNVVVKRWVRKGQKDAGEGSSQSKRGEVDHKELQFGTLPGLAKEKSGLVILSPSGKKTRF